MYSMYIKGAPYIICLTGEYCTDIMYFKDELAKIHPNQHAGSG